MGFTSILWRIPEVTAKAIANESDDFFIEEDRDGFDYVYALDSLARLEGPTFSALRRDLSQLNRGHPPHESAELDLCDAVTRRDLQSVMSLWKSQKLAEGTVENYQSALDNCLRGAGCFDLIGIGAIVGGSLAGFTLAERIGNGWMLSHFAAADPRFSGMSGSLLHQLARAGAELGYVHVNYQEDVGNLYATREIDAHEELLLDYSVLDRCKPPGFSSAGKIRCRCGSDHCKGLVDFL